MMRSGGRKPQIGVVTPVLIACAILGVASADSVSTPYVFQPNTVALASEVNANFLALEEAINANLQILEDAIETYDERIAGLESAVAERDARIEALEAAMVVTSPDGPATIIRGAVNADGTLQVDSGGAFTCTRTDEGMYEIRVKATLVADLDQGLPAMVVTPVAWGGTVTALTVEEDPATDDHVYAVQIGNTFSGLNQDTTFLFLVVGPNTGK